MGTYLNPGNSGFAGIRNDIYVDKSGMISLINQTIDTPRCLTCISRPRRFGKSFAAKMLCASIRETPASQKEYLEFLRTLFKGSGTTDKIFAAVYMTGILPIKKDGTESAISDFWEYSMLDPGCFQTYVGFTEAEVKHLCEKYDVCFSDAKRWYDGYSFDSLLSIYNPYSIIKAVNRKKFKSYWRMSSAADSLEAYISCDYDGLFTSVLELLGGLSIPIDTSGFNNDIATIRNRDDVLTLLIHLGYLTYDESEETVRILNEEIRMEFTKSVQEVKSTAAIQRLQESRQLIQDTVLMNADAVAAQVEKIHAEMTAPMHYNNEQSLRSVIHIAYYSYPDHYVKFEELPSGNGYADIVYLPKRTSQLPALVIELKWNQSAKGAIAQIKDRQYFTALKDYGGDILLVGISYDKNAKDNRRRHSCIIEKFRPH